MNPIDLANLEQRRASDPRVCAFVSASAGTGKTKLLTDRLLRLMLGGTAPDKILCLTYTKAAAAEMVLRLNARLGAWVVMQEAELAAELRALDVPVKRIGLARKLFADVLDLPGGMRIETIHAFCQSLLRRFPLEAGLSPHFEVADADRAGLRLREAREAVLAEPGHRAAIFALAAETDEQRFAELTAELAGDESEVLRTAPAEPLAAMLRAALGAGEDTSEAILRAAVAWPREKQLRAVLQRLARFGNKTGQDYANEALAWLARHHEDRVTAWELWLAAHLTAKGEPRSLKKHCGKHLAAEEAGICDEITQECVRIAAVQEKLKAVRLAELNAHLAGLAAPILHGEQREKQLAAQLSYGDLVRFTGQLLIDPGAAWVLYKLDGGIDHLLLDEVQDTAPAQWEIAAAIAEEFFAGSGAREAERSIFAVGDAKQSIFSFQGADLKSFETYRRRFKDKVQNAGARWEDGRLSVSFRSTAPVLALVDAVFAAGPAREGVAAPGESLHHQVSRLGQGGAVTLWPLTPPAEAAPLPDWQVPAEYERAESAKAVLARKIAEHIQSRLGEILPSRNRPVRPGDFLILVRRREALVAAITAELKRRQIPVAGIDRMVLTAQPAVSDLLALCDALLLPEDDLAFAQYLVSPLGGLSDASLMELALGRGGESLLAALYRRAPARADWSAAKSYFEALRAKVDYLTPFALLSEALGVLGGRARLLRRLGAEAAEPIEELLTEALNFLQEAPGALQNFLHQLRQSGAMIKREAEAAGDVVRIMTVHGAKGLQAPIVILPDTTTLPDARLNLFWLPVPQQPGISVPVFCPRGAQRSGAIATAAADARAAQAEEYNRLLYVALTRAEDELIICGAEGKQKLPETSWYARVTAGFRILPGAAPSNGGWRLASPQTAPPDRASAHATARVEPPPAWAGAAPDWAATPPAREQTRPERLAPSRGAEDDAKRAIAASPLAGNMAALRGARAAAMAKGSAVHALLQHLPELPAPAREAAALRYLAGIAELRGQAASIWAQLRAVLAHPDLEALFGPGSRAEVPLAGIIADVEIGGLVDRLAITPTRILIADYKTDRAPPAAVDAVPERYLRQLGAYRRILTEIYPNHGIHAVLIWTETAHIMPVPPALLSRHAPA